MSSTQAAPGQGHEPEGWARPRRALLVAQPRHREQPSALSAAIAALEAGGVELVQETCHAATDLSPLILRHAPVVDLVVLCGGDGTMNAAARGLIGSRLPFGILPLGTANDLARTLGIPPDVATAAQVILDGHQRRIDLGEVNGHPFFNVASVGVSVAVARELTGDLKKRWGRLAYLIASLRVLPRARPFHAEITCDGELHRVRTLQVAVGNGRYYGGGMAVEEAAEPDDGVLHLYSLEFPSAWWLAPLLPALRAGRHGRWRQVRTASCREAEIRTRRPRSVNADGEIVSHTPARLRVLRHAVSVLAPRPEG